MINKRILTALLCVILILTASVIPTTLVSARTSTEYDYSKMGSYFNTTFTSADILDLLGAELSDGERAYLDAHGTVNLKYETVTTQQISVVSIDNSTTVIARPYAYVSAKGSEATWTPSSVSVDSLNGSFSEKDGEYVAVFEDLTVNDDSTVSVDYVLDVTFIISPDDINEILNLAYSNAPAIKASVESARSDYNSKKSAYDAFYAANGEAVEKYHSDTLLYNQYLIDKAVYDERYSAYLTYLDEYSVYSTQLDLYNTYLSDLDEYNAIIDNNLNYEDNLAKYNVDIVSYNEYVAKMKIVKEQVTALHNGLMTKVTPLKRQLHSALFSSLIDDVIAANKEAYITMLGISEDAINDCISASNDIQAILAPKDGVAYKKLKTDEDKYEFYVNNRDELCRATSKLAAALYDMYSNQRLRLLMHSAPTLVGKDDYTEKLSIFISQLILFSNALTDDPVMSYDGSFILDGNVTFHYWDADGKEIKNRTAIDVLGGESYVEDTGNSVPIAGGYPDEVKEPTLPVLMTVPEKPTPVTRPIEPTLVTDPGEAPAELILPTPPDGYMEKPVIPTILNDSSYSLLISDLDSGKLVERDEVSIPLEYTPTLTLVKHIGGTDTVTVTFTDGRGNVVSEINVAKGTAANFVGEIPIREEDIISTYTFHSWVDINGNIYDLSRANEDVTLYPQYSPSYKEIDVEYNVNGTGKNVISIFDPDHILTCLPINKLAEVARESSAGLKVKAKNVTLELSYASLLELDSLGVSYLDIFVDTSSTGVYYADIRAMNEWGEQVTADVDMIFAIPCADSSFASKSLLTCDDSDGNTVYVNKSYSEGLVRFTANTNVSYTLAVRYSINLPSSLRGKVHAPEDAIAGSTVTVTVDVPLGSTAEMYYFLESDSTTKHSVDGFTFTMPHENINLRVKYTEIIYTVTFVSDGKEISVRTYKYGDTVRVPNSPTKLHDAEYSYTFIGWSPEVQTVSADIVYEAIFERTPLVKDREKFPWFTVIFYTVLTVILIGIPALIIFILDRKGVISVKNILASLKRKLSRVGANEADTSDAITAKGEDNDLESTNDECDEEK